MSRPVCYFTDEHIAPAIASGLRKRGVDVLTIVEAGWLGVEDEDLLSFVRDEERVIVPQDRDFLRSAVQVDDPPEVVYAPQERSIGEMVRLLNLLARVSDTEEMRGRVEYL